MKTGDVINVGPEKVTWNPSTRTLEGEIKGKKIIVPTGQLALQDIKWNRIDFQKAVELATKSGFTAIVRRVEDDKITASIREWQERRYEFLQEGEVYQSRVIYVTPYSLHVYVKGIRVRVYVTDCTRTRMSNLCEFFKEGEKMKVKILKKQQEFPYHIDGSRKEVYPTLKEAHKEYKVGSQIYVMICERLNDDGYRVEVTPNIPGILNGIKEELDKLKRGSRIRAEIIEIDKLGIKCRVAKGRRL